MDIVNLLEQIKDIVRKAGEIILQAQNLRLTQKAGNQNFVTQYDTQVEDFLISNLQTLLPQSAVLAEESNPQLVTDKDWVFIVDPIDGTANFINHINHSAISIALAFRKKLVLAVIYNPYNNELFSAIADGGAFLNGQAIKVSKRLFTEAIIGFGTTPYNTFFHPNTLSMLGKCLGTVREIRRMGSAALDLAYLACGRFDGFFEFQLQAWDFAAGALIIKEAKGLITTMAGAEIDPFQASSIVAGNKIVYFNLVNLLDD